MPKGIYKRPEAEQKFWGSVEIDFFRGCWNWTFTKLKSGYGLIWDKKYILAHRYSYMLLKGDIPKNLQLDHLCRNPSCVNPYHLEPVTALENQLRSPISFVGQKQCRRGHPYEGENVYIDPKGRGYCIKCIRVHQREYVERQKLKKGKNT